MPHARAQGSVWRRDGALQRLHLEHAQPDIAAATGLVRSKNQGVLNIAVLKAGKPLRWSAARSRT
jgi:hypothetical protein